MEFICLAQEINLIILSINFLAKEQGKDGEKAVQEQIKQLGNNEA